MRKLSLKIGNLPKIIQDFSDSNVLSKLLCAFHQQVHIKISLHRHIFFFCGIQEKAPKFFSSTRWPQRLLRKIKFYFTARMHLTLSSLYLIDSLQVTAALNVLEKHFSLLVHHWFFDALKIAVEEKISVNLFWCLCVITYALGNCAHTNLTWPSFLFKSCSISVQPWQKNVK